MSKVFEFEQTGIPGRYSINLKDNFGITWLDSKSADLYRAMFTAIANTLKFNMSKTTPRIGMSIKDDKGHFKLGAVLNYRKPEEDSEEDSGNWYLEMTFNADDMVDLDLEIDNHSDMFLQCASLAAQNICYGRFRSTEIMYNMFNTAIDTLTSYLDINAQEGEEVTINLRGIFSASVEIDNGVKYMTIVPGEYIKQAIKNDAALS